MSIKSLSEKDKREICDAVGKSLIDTINSDKMKAETKKEIEGIVKKKGLTVDPLALFDAMEFHLQVRLKQ
ncbi:MAG: hypothetical protein QG670_2288 [Thermoproteota archaeon]|nr:hypothetical protein [Thermoproteota archaeon]